MRTEERIYMKLISCGHCGVVLDTNRIKKPHVNAWYDGVYIEAIICPCCKEAIVYENGNMVTT